MVHNVAKLARKHQKGIPGSQSAVED
uniref:Uncharacterized protein n=1 Tax=Rhizophora mucronata TaxID=61149 RepID=A0A2P2MYB1_RHIMU